MLKIDLLESILAADYMTLKMEIKTANLEIKFQFRKPSGFAAFFGSELFALLSDYQLNAVIASIEAAEKV